MRARHPPLPRLWLMTDPRIGDLLAAVRALPKGAGIVFRHYELGWRDRRALFKQVKEIAKARRLVLLLADRPGVARAWGAAGAHHRSALVSRGLRSVPVHDVPERVTARRVCADLIFVSPVFATRSHPAARPLGRIGLLRVAGGRQNRTIALGGMNAARRLPAVHGWAAIDALAAAASARSSWASRARAPANPNPLSPVAARSPNADPP